MKRAKWSQNFCRKSFEVNQWIGHPILDLADCTDFWAPFLTLKRHLRWMQHRGAITGIGWMDWMGWNQCREVQGGNKMKNCSSGGLNDKFQVKGKRSELERAVSGVSTNTVKQVATFTFYMLCIYISHI